MSPLASNALAIITSGYKNRRLLVRVKKSKLVIQILNLFYNNGFIRGFSFSVTSPYEIIVFLKYVDSKPILKKFQILSSSGRRTYCKSSYILTRLVNNGFFVISTSTLGLVTTLQLLAVRKDNKTGGELLFKILF
jgi:ribosomal protein S8